MADTMRFHVRAATPGQLAPPSDPLDRETVKAALDMGTIGPTTPVKPENADFWAPAAAWAGLDLPCDPPARHVPERLDMPAELAALSDEQRDGLRWWLRDGGRAHGPFAGPRLRDELTQRYGAAILISLAGGDAWFPQLALEQAGEHAWRAAAVSAGVSVPCDVCLEEIPAEARICPECGERTALPSQRAPMSSIGEDAPGASWLRMHWRPLLTMSAIGGLIAFGIALRFLAPNRYQPPERLPAGAAAVADAVCESTCWHSESCQMGRCVWQAPNDVGHIDDKPTVAGPFELPSNMVDVLPLDGERYAVSHLQGVQVINARTGGLLTKVSEAPMAQRMYRVGDAVYATSPKRIYVIDAATAKVTKTIELGATVGDLTVGASGQRVLASLPGAKAVAVIATDYHAEVSRFFFGDDHVRAVSVDDTGTRALTTNGRRPLAGAAAGLEGVRYGAMYAFDPSRLPSEQDRVRTALIGNPVDIVMMPDAKSSYALLREEDAIIRLERQESGAVRQESRMSTCREPEAIELIRHRRRAIVRCNAGKALEVFDLETLELQKHIPTNARVADMAITPDGRRAIVALPRDTDRANSRGGGEGAIGLLNLDTYELELHEVNAEPHRVRIAPDGRTAIVISDRKKLAWVVR
jgi:DNA-binding beta-propeller fold protein YncE